MRQTTLLCFLCLTAASSATTPLAAQSTTLACGLNKVTALANSDTLVSIPFSRPAAFIGGIASVSSNTLTVSGTTEWQDNQFVYGTTLTSGGTQHNTYYALIGPNPVVLAGTISLNAGSNLVTGVGTNFTTAISPGDGIILSGSTSGYFIVQSVTDNTDLVITNNAPASLTAQTAEISKSVKEGYTYEVTANATVNGVSTVTLNLNGDTISTIVAGTQVSLIPYWTLSTLFPPSDLGVSYIGTNIVRSMQTQILMPNYGHAGINNSPFPLYFYSNTYSEWLLEGGTASNAGDTIFLPDGYFTIRNAATATTLTSLGVVNDQRLSVPLTTGTGTGTAEQDNYVSIMRPVAVALRDSNLIGSGAFTPSPSIRNAQDQLYLYNNAVAGINKSADINASYIYMSGHWQHIGGTLGVDAGSDTIPAGAAIQIRKASGNGSTVFWINQPTY